MLALIIVSLIIGFVVAGFSGIGMLGTAAGVIFFVCGLPFALIGSFVHGEVSYTQDRADYRQCLAECSRDRRADEHELAEDIRTDCLTDVIRKTPKRVYNDNRKQIINLHGRV